MTLLAADIGNAHTVLGLVSDGEVTDDWRVATDAHRTADEWAVLIRGLLDRRPRVRYTAGPTAGRVRTLRRFAPTGAFDRQIRKLNRLAG
jgi:hypothetical protein